eukprot:5048947-Pleurochrysis_carterae.AAC.1
MDEGAQASVRLQSEAGGAVSSVGSGPEAFRDAMSAATGAGWSLLAADSAPSSRRGEHPDAAP